MLRRWTTRATSGRAAAAVPPRLARRRYGASVRWPIGLLVVVLAVGLLACGDEASSGGNASDEQQSAESARPKCQKARKVLVRALASSLTITGGGGLKRVSVAKVQEPPEAPLAGFRKGVYAVAGQFTGAGIDGTMGIWAVSSEMVRTGGGLAIGADSVTRGFSDLGAAASIDSPAADYAREIADSQAGEQARGCAEGS